MSYKIGDKIVVLLPCTIGGTEVGSTATIINVLDVDEYDNATLLTIQKGNGERFPSGNSSLIIETRCIGPLDTLSTYGFAKPMEETRI